MPSLHKMVRREGIYALRTIFIAFLFITLRSIPSAAQSPFIGAPMEGPVLAAVPATHDRIILYDLGTEARRELTFGMGELHLWDFSADGCRVLFTMGRRDEPDKLYSARLDGSDLRPMVDYTDLPAEAWGVWEPDWSPDGSRIAFTMMRDTSALDRAAPQAEDDLVEYRIAWIPAEGGTPSFYSVSGDEHTPRWSHDSQWLAYVAYEERVPGPDPYSTAEPTRVPAPGEQFTPLPLLREADLWVVSTDGEEKYRLTYFNTGSVSNPRWSPDNQLLGFLYSPVGNNDQFWMIANQPGSIPTQLSETWTLALDLTWLPDGTAMLAAVRDFQETSENRLWRIPLVGNADTNATLYSQDTNLTYTDFPRFSPDGSLLAMRSAYSLVVVNVADGAWVLWDEVALGNSPPIWSPAAFAGEAQCL